MDTVCLFGGGRWSRVLLGVLLEGFPEIKSIIWVTKNGYLENTEWLNSLDVNKVKIIQDAEQAWSLRPQAAIIATASYMHVKYVKEALVRKIPVLSEKPFCFSMEEAQELVCLSRSSQIPAGVNFEFTHASYLSDFARSLSGLDFHSIDIIWQDPFCETRHGEIKIGDFYTPLMHDSFQHCWSLLYFLLPNEPINISSVLYNKDSSVLVEMHTENKRISISLSRRSEKRSRIISVNQGAAVLDFSKEPGITVINGKTVQNEWHGDRPLLSVLRRFFEIIKQKNQLQHWSLSIDKCLTVIGLSEQAAKLLEQSQQDCFEKKDQLSPDDIVTRNLLIDIYLPKLTAMDEYHRVHNLQDQVAFSRHVINKFLLKNACLQKNN